MNILSIPLHDGVWYYLGVPLSITTLRRQAFNPLFDRIHKRLDAWKWKHLSQAGRITRIRSILNSTYIYLLTNTHVPMSVLHEIEKIVKLYLWGHEPGNRAAFDLLEYHLSS